MRSRLCASVRRKTYDVKLSEAPSDEQTASANTETEKPNEGVSTPKLGITVEPVSAELARNLPDGDRGLMVSDVAGAGPAYNKLTVNDIIVAVLFPEPRREVHTVADLQAALAKSKTGDYVTSADLPRSASAAGAVPRAAE